LENIFNLLTVGLYEGLVWFPFVLAVGILYRYIKIIDISIEGVAVLAGITAAMVFNLSHSYLFSLFSAFLSAIVGYLIVFLFIRKFTIHPILAGIIFTLIIHSLSALVIGESLILQGTTLFQGVFSFSWLTLAVSLIILIIAEYFFRSNLGLQIRFNSSEKSASNNKSIDRSMLYAFLVVSIIVGTGSFLYIHKQGVARSGSGFEYLIVALGSFLITDKMIEMLLRPLISHQKFTYRKKIYILVNFLRSPVFKALLGSLSFQIVAIFIIFYTPNPAWWKLLFALILLIGVASLPSLRKNLISSVKLKHISIKLVDINFSYSLGYMKKQVFKNLNAEFSPGVNIIWGENGSGKSSLLKLISQTLVVESGRIEYSGDFNYPESVFYLTQNPFDSMNREMTVYENLCVSLSDKGIYITKISKIRRLLNVRLKQFGMEELNKNDEMLFFQEAGSLSGGQAQKVLLFMTVLNNPHVILADEPSSGMDENNLIGLFKVITSFASEDRIIIMATHDTRLKNLDANHFELKNGLLSK